MDQKVYSRVKLFAERIKPFLPVKMIILYGSYAKGTERPDSDIDVAVVVEELNDNWLKVNSKLLLISSEIDDKIEPNLIICKGNKSGFVESIMNYGIVIYDNSKVA